jgi:hypothetical protein
VFKLPFPLRIDPPDAAGDLQALAEATEAALANGHRFTTYRVVSQSVPAGSAWTALAGTGTATGPDAASWSGGQFTFPTTGLWRVMLRALQIQTVSPAADMTCRIGAGNAQGSGRLIPGATWGGMLAVAMMRPTAGAALAFTAWHGAAAAVPLELVVTTEHVGS